MRVGWSGELEPRLKFHNCVARTRGRKVEMVHVYVKYKFAKLLYCVLVWQ